MNCDNKEPHTSHLNYGSGIATQCPGVAAVGPDEGPGMDAIRVERLRQVTMEGFDADHDDTHVNGELAALASAYIVYDLLAGLAPNVTKMVPDGFDFKPRNHQYNLERAGALIAAEIERLMRMKQ